MKLYKHLALSHAKNIIMLANKGYTRYKINKLTGISDGKIKRCLKTCLITKIKANNQKPWRQPKIIKKYSFKIYKFQRDQSKLNKAFEYAIEAVKIYQPFIDFCQKLYEAKILNIKVKRSADEYIKEFKKAHFNEDYPKRDWVYKMAKSIHYEFNPKWLPSTKKAVIHLKSDDERKKPEKYNSIETRPDKKILRGFPGNFEIDGVIGKRNDNQALLTMIDINTGDFYSKFFNRKMTGFRDAFRSIIEENNLAINTLTMDNGGENNLLHEVIDKSKLFNCHPYSSGEKGTLENKHRIVRRIFKKSTSLDKYTNEDLIHLNKFVNNYYSKVFNRI